MNPQNEVTLASSAALRPAFENSVSVTAKLAGVVGAAWSVVPQARRPAAKVVTADGLQAPVLAMSFTTMDVGCAGVSVLLTRSEFAESETNAFGVTVHEQHEINCSSGENV